jgi:hypothetical protein
MVYFISGSLVGVVRVSWHFYKDNVVFSYSNFSNSFYHYIQYLILTTLGYWFFLYIFRYKLTPYSKICIAILSIFVSLILGFLSNPLIPYLLMLHNYPGGLSDAAFIYIARASQAVYAFVVAAALHFIYLYSRSSVKPIEAT